MLSIGFHMVGFCAILKYSYNMGDVLAYGKD